MPAALTCNRSKSVLYMPIHDCELFPTSLERSAKAVMCHAVIDAVVQIHTALFQQNGSTTIDTLARVVEHSNHTVASSSRGVGFWANSGMPLEVS